MVNRKINYYRILQVDSSAEPEVIEGAYRRLAKKYHPDANISAVDAQRRMQLINEAYQVLSNPQKRAQYDLQQSSIPQTGHNDFGEAPVPVRQNDFGVAAPVSSKSRVENNKTTNELLFRIARIVLNVAIGVLVLMILGIVIWMVRDRLFPPKTKPVTQKQQQVTAAATTTIDTKEVVDLSTIQLAPFASAAQTLQGGVSRLAMLHTTIPTRPRSNVLTYTVVKGDNLFLIGEKFGIKPESVLWANYDTLQDNYRMLSIGQELNILPTDGVYYQWKKDDSLAKVATDFKVKPQEILEYAGNRFDLSVSTVDNPGIKEGTWLVIPGGKRALKDWGPPAISRSDPAVAAYYGEGYCGKVYTGAVGSGAFVWPVPSNHTISGYDYTEIHKGIDIGGNIGAAVVAADSGVVVFSGWSEYGYGNFLVIDHGNGWQTAYGHLNSVGATCGQSVMGGGTVATLGSSGNSTGPHLHFEMKYNGANANPHDFIQ